MDLGLPDLFPAAAGGAGVRPVVKLVKGPAAPTGGGFGADLLSAAAGALGLGGGSQPDPLTDCLSSLVVHLAPAPFVAHARLRFLPREDFPDLAPGDELAVQLGFDDNPQSVLAGRIAMLARRGDGSLDVTLASKAIMLAGQRENTGYEQQSFSDVLSQWAALAQLTPGDITSGPSYPFLAVDDRASLWDWIARLARHAGVPAWVDASGQLQAHATSGPPVRTFKYGADVLAFEATARDPMAGAASIAGEGSAGTDGATAWAWLAKDNGANQATSGDGPAIGWWSDGALRSTAAIQDAADGQAAAAKRLATTVRVTVPGAPDIDVASPFAIEGCPNGLGDGAYSALQVRHRFDTRRGLVTELVGGAS
jgi:hypothetical protein